MKAKRTFYNLLFGLSSQVLTIILGILIPRLILVNYGSEVNGLLSSIGQIFVYFGLLEVGVGGASLQALYKPIAMEDKEEINSILAATSKYYNKTGIYYSLCVVMFTIIYPIVVSTNLSIITIVMIIGLAGICGSLNYFLKSKYLIFLIADGRTYINTIILTISDILISILKIALLLMGVNIIFIQSIYLIIGIAQIICIRVYMGKKYRWMDFKVNPNFKAIGQKKSVMVHQISTLVFQNTDILVLTFFCGLKVVSVYVMYNLIFSMVDTAILTINSSVTFALGQTYAEDKEKYKKYYDAYEVYYMAITFALFAVAYVLILPFIGLYTSGVEDIKYVDTLLPMLFVAYKLLSCARTPAGNAIIVAGHFKGTQKQAIIESTINILFTIIFVNIFGIYGVLLGTIVALLYRAADMVIYSNRKILKRSPWVTARRWIVDAVLFILIAVIFNIFKIHINSYMSIMVWGVILSLTILPVYFIVASIFDRSTYALVLNKALYYFKKHYKKHISKRKYVLESQK